MTYVACHLRYGSLVFLPNKSLDLRWDNWDKGTKEFMRKYNASIKLMMKIPCTTANHIIKNLMGGMSAEAIIFKNYLSNANKWEQMWREN